jgi:predicted nucleotidyltransferase
VAQIANDVLNSVERFLDAVQRNRKIDAAYIYGSQVLGIAHAWSDIDVALISRDFSENLFQETIELMNLAAGIDERIEPRPFTPDRFGPNDPLASEIKRTGQQLI